MKEYFESSTNVIDDWSCNTTANAEIFPFGYIDNDELFNIDTLPSYDTISKAAQINSLVDNDIDTNMSSNINHKPVEFQGVTFLKRVSIMKQLILIV